jgi:ParB-like chromosome segregation protein Spo0J
MNIRKIDINKLVNAYYNPRKDLQPNDAEYKKIKASIENFGYIDPVIVNSDMTVVGGHQRLKVLKELGYREIDCVVVDMDKTQEKALNIALNKITGEWDMPALKDLLLEIDTGEIDLTLTGFDIDELETLMTQVRLDDVDVKDSVAVPKLCPHCGLDIKG